MYSNFEVIRLIWQDSNYHVINDYVAGEALGTHVLQQPNIEKEQFFAWIMQILNQMDFKAPYCQQITPYHIVLKSDNTVALLNTETKVNQKFLARIESFPFIEKFRAGGELGNQFYSFGKTLQFLLAKSNLSPSLTYGEERKLQKIISKCLTENPKKQYQRFADIASDFPLYSEKINQRKSKREYRKKFIRLAWVLVLVFSWALTFYFGSMENKRGEAYFELGLTYFAMEDYQKSYEMFGNAEKQKYSQCYGKMASYMYGDDEDAEEIENMVREMMEDKKEFSIEEKRCLIRVYNKIDTNYARGQVIKIGKEILRDSEWNENDDEIRVILAGVYQRAGQYRNAWKQYEELLKNQCGEEEYKTMIEICQKCGEHEEALSLCVDGMFHNEKSTLLEVAYISLICQNKEFTKEEKEGKIADIIKKHTELLEEQRFQTLQVQYGIKVEGEEVWLEKSL